MKKNKTKQRKLRKCEQGIKTKSHNRGCKYTLGANGFVPSFIADSFRL